MEDGSYSEELSTAVKAVTLSAKLTSALQNRLPSTNSQIQKFDFSPVTIGDFAVQTLLTSAIHGAFPHDTFLAEESADDLRKIPALHDQVWSLITQYRDDFTAAGLSVPETKDEIFDLLDRGGKNLVSDQGRTWVFDPIDGTATFLKGGQYAINCAFLVDGREQLGLIACPNVAPDAKGIHEEGTGEPSHGGVLIYASRSGGTWARPLANADAEPRRIERHGDHATIDGLGFTDCAGYTSTILALHQRVAAELKAEWPGVDLFSSLMKYAALGLGHASVCIRIFKYGSWRSNMWDHAGGVLIFEEVGGKVTDLEGKSIDFTKGRKMADNHGLVCAPSSIHAEVLRLVQEVIKQHGPIPWSKEA